MQSMFAFLPLLRFFGDGDFRRRYHRMRSLRLFLAAFLPLAVPVGLQAQSGTPFVYPLTLTPDYNPTYNEAIGASVLVRDETTLAPLTGTVNFTVDGGPAIAATLNGSGLAYANLGQLSIATHTVKATYLGNAQYSGGSISGTIQVGDAPLAFVGTQGTTLFSSGVVFDAEGVAVDAQDNLYVSDKSSGKIYREDTLGNVATIPVTGLKSPVGMALDSAGNLYIADTGNNRIVEYSASGAQTVVPTSKLSAPTYLAYDRTNNILYIADTGNNRVESYTPATKVSTDVVTGMTALRGVSVDTQGTIYFSDGNAGFLQIPTFSGLSSLPIPIYAPVGETGSIAAGVFPYVIVSDLAGNGVFRYNNDSGEPYQGGQVQINNSGNPVVDVAADSTGRVYLAVGTRVDVVDTGSGRAPDVGVNPPNGEGNSIFSLIFQTPQGKPSFTVTASPATTFNQFGAPSCPGGAGACAAQGYFVPQFAGVNAGSIGVTTTYDIGDVPVWGKGIGGGAAFTPGTISQSSSGAGRIGGVAFDSAGNRYVTDTANNTVTEFSPSGAKTPLGFTGLSKPTEIAVDGLGAVYVLDSGNQRIVRRGADGVQADVYEASDEEDFASISAFSLDGDSNLLLAGLPGSPDVGVRKNARAIGKDSASTGSYIVGLEGHSFPPDGKKVDLAYPYEHTGLIQANLPEVTGVAVDAEENIFAVDTGGTLTRFGIDGTTKQIATGLGSPLGVALDPSGTAYVLEATSITLIEPDGAKSSIAVNGLYSAAAFALDPYGDIVIGDGADLQLIYLDRTQQNYVFGDVNVGQPETLDGSIGNVGNQPFTISAALPADGNFAQTGTSNACASPGGSTPGTTVAPGGECDLDYTFTPPSDGPFTLSGTLVTTPQTLIGSGGGGAIHLSGTGEGSSGPNPLLTPTTMNFGDVLIHTVSANQTATLTNTGTAALTVYGFSVTGKNLGGFGYSDNCGKSLAAGASCTIAINCVPAIVETLTASFNAIFPSPIPQQSIALTCNATDFSAALTPAAASFTAAIGSTSAAQTFTLVNAGSAALPITSVGFSGTGASSFTVSGNTCGSSLAGNSSCTVAVTFSPASAGSLSVILSVVDGAGTQTSTLTGTGTAPAAPQPVLTPASISFGSQTVGTSSAAQTATLKNAGNGTLFISSFGFFGSNTASFSETNNCGASLAAGSSCSIAVVCTPASAGSLSANLGANFPSPIVQQSIALSCTGVAAATPEAALTPSTASFTAISGSTSAPQKFTLANAGKAALTIQSISLEGANAPEFSIASKTCGGSLAAGASCTISVTFAPVGTGSATAALSVSDNASGSPQTSSLTGTATAPAATLAPATLDFGSVETGAKSAAKTAKLSNTGNAALSIGRIAVGGTNSAAFAETNNCGGSLAAGASCTISVTFDPTAAGADSATISVADNAPGSPQTSALTGTATAPPPPADFALSATPASQSVVAGGSAVYQVKIASVDGSFTSPVTLAASGLPPGATVAFAPSSATPGSAGAESAMTVQTAAQQGAMAKGPARWPVPAGLISAALLLVPFRRRRRIYTVLGCLILPLAFCGALTACGGGFALPQTKPPSATYTISVTGTSGSHQHSTRVQITVR